MVLKSTRDNDSSLNTSNEGESEGQRTDTSQETQEPKKKTRKKFYNTKPRTSTLSSASTSTAVTTVRSHQTRIPRSVPLVPFIPIPVTSMAPYYPQMASSSISYPIVNEWNTVQVQSPMYNIPSLTFPPVPIVLAPPVLTTICPYSLVGQPIIAPALPPPITIEEIPHTYDSMAMFSPEQTVPTEDQEPDGINISSENTMYEPINCNRRADPVDVFLALPRQLFPTARMLALNPNPVIDEFCKIVDIHRHAPWILDLEFGVPRVPITRPIAAYNVKFNSIHCKNTPNAIHPGFESCSEEFKSVLLFYYDYIISSWYRGYTLMNQDASVENFQSWIHLPTQRLGMCWP